MEITSVKLQENGYLVNGNMYVPNDPANRHYQMVQDWIALGNTPEPIETPAEEQARLLREHEAEKSRRLGETDFTQLIDENALLSPTEQTDIADYRNQVRNATLASGFPHAPSWFSSRL